MTATPAERVQAGTAWLDANIPDWTERVTLEEFDITNTCRCVLGQLFTPVEVLTSDAYGYAVARRDLDDDHGIVRLAESGFDRAIYDMGVVTAAEAEAFGFDDGNDDWAPLQAEWERVLAART